MNMQRVVEEGTSGLNLLLHKVIVEVIHCLEIILMMTDCSKTLLGVDNLKTLKQDL